MEDTIEKPVLGARYTRTVVYHNSEGNASSHSCVVELREINSDKDQLLFLCLDKLEILDPYRSHTTHVLHEETTYETGITNFPVGDRSTLAHGLAGKFDVQFITYTLIT